MLANKVYRTFYTPLPLHLEAGIWNKERNNEAAPVAMIDELILGLLQLCLLPYRCPLNLHQEEVFITPFLEGYLLPL